MTSILHELGNDGRAADGPVLDIIGRNQKNCSGYAALYLQHPDLFKWVGASIFSCHRIGMLLAVYDLIAVDGKLARTPLVGAFEALLPGVALEHVSEQLDWIRLANNAIYDEVEPAHRAYLSGGLAEVERNHAGKDGLVESFRMLDQARQLKPSNPGAADDLVWQSQTLLGEYEQRVILQPHFDQLGPSMRLVLSTFGWMDFELEWVTSLRDLVTPDELAVDSLAVRIRHEPKPRFTSFVIWSELERHRTKRPDAPSINLLDFDQRWGWVRDSVIPLWRKVDRDDPFLRERIAKVINEPLPAVTAAKRLEQGILALSR